MPKNEVCLEVFKIPYELFQNTTLKKLSLTIDEFDLGHSETLEPNFLTKLTELETLDLTGVRISAEIFANEICRLTDLVNLTLMYANLSHIPDEIINLVNLKNLCLRGNRIDTLPPGFDKLSKLGSLNLIDNEFKTIPNQLLQMNHLVDLNFRHNPLDIASMNLMDDWGTVVKR
jgi:Leucine-rich repeat (LRR) protein